MHQNLFLS